MFDKVIMINKWVF